MRTALASLVSFSISVVLVSALTARADAASDSGKTSAALADADVAAIRAASDAHALGAQTGDWSAYANTFAADGLFLTPNSPAKAGRDAIEAFARSLPPLQDVRIELIEVEGRGDLAFVRGRYSLVLLPANQPPQPDTGKFIGIWRKQPNGSWLISRELFNSDLPVAVAATGATSDAVRAENATPETEADKTAVIAVIEEEKNAYVALDEARMTATWVQRPSSLKLYVLEGKETLYDGWAAIVAHDRENLARERATPAADRSRFEFSNYRVTLQGDSAWATCHSRWDGVWEGARTSSTGSRIYVLHKESGRWKIALLAISELTPEKPGSTAASDRDPLEGTWELVSGRWTGKDGTTLTLPGNVTGRGIKMYANGHFSFVGRFTEAGKPAADDYGGGTFTLNGEECTETIDFHVNPDAVGRTPRFRVVINGDTMTQTGPFLPDGQPNPEIQLVEVYRRKK